MADDRPNQLLHIYDADDLSIRQTAWSRRNQNLGTLLETYPVPISGGVQGLQDALDKLLAEQKSFPRVLFETHGNVGTIFFGKEAINAGVLNDKFAHKGYDSIFSYYSVRIYFNGCNIADGGGGSDFLDAAGRIFLRRGGGVVFAQTGSGFPVPPWSLLTGHVVHFLSTTYYSVIAPGGLVIGHTTD